MGLVGTLWRAFRQKKLQGILRRIGFRLCGRRDDVILVLGLADDSAACEQAAAPSFDDLSFRSMTVADLEALVEVIPTSLVNYQRPRALKESLRNDLGAGLRHLIAIQGGRPVAGVWMPEPTPIFDSVPGLAGLRVPPVRMVMRFFVAASARGKGLGTIVLREAIRQAKADGTRTLVSLIHSDNVASLKAHERNGFRRVGLVRTCCFLGCRRESFPSLESADEASSPAARGGEV
ncbi:MAG: GNAT family N-acetyltransferase [Planctomycetes bacterium]|nr:GNAT family N-acetyltransferase [Planctomycetota bacterium]